MEKMTEQMDIIAEYYKGIREYTLNRRCSGNSQRIYMAPDSRYWLVLEKTGENALQARQTDENGVIVAWDNYLVRNADIRLVEAVRMSVGGRRQISFSSAEISVIDRYGNYDRRATIGKLDILLGRFKDKAVEDAARSLTDKLEWISNQTYTDIHSVGERRREVEAGRGIGRRIERAKAKAEKQNMQPRISDQIPRFGKGRDV